MKRDLREGKERKKSEDMKAFRIFIFLLVATLLGSTATAKAEGTPNHSPSLLDMPDKGLYYGFIMNNSFNFIEVSIWSFKNKKRVYRNIVLPPASSKNEGDGQALEYWNKSVDAFRPPNVFSLWLQLDTYKISIRQRNDIVANGQAGVWKTFVVVLDNEYIENAKGPFTLEIKDD
jgi:hypothetical protein